MSQQSPVPVLNGGKGGSSSLGRENVDAISSLSLGVPSDRVAYKWYNSCHVPLELQIGIRRLEFPLDMKVRSLSVPEDITITAQIFCNHHAVYSLSLSTSYSVIDDGINSLVWDSILSSAIKIQNLSHDAAIVLTALTSDGCIYGGTSVSLFDDKGLLKSGKQKLVFFFGQAGCIDVAAEHATWGDTLYNDYKRMDEHFAAEKVLETFRKREKEQAMNVDDTTFPDSDWLDSKMLSVIQANVRRVLPEPHSSTSSRIYTMSNSETPSVSAADAMQAEPPLCRHPLELDLQQLAFLVIELPTLPHPVLFEDRTYHQVPPNLLLKERHAAFTHPGAHPCAIKGEKGLIEFSLHKGNFHGSMLSVISDWDLEMDGFPNLAEEKNRRLNISTIRGATDPNAQPNLEEKALLDRIVNGTGGKLASADKDLVYRFRYALTENKRALTKVLLSIDWEVEKERAEVPILLGLWKSKAPIDVADALQLLCNQREFQNPVIRQYAVDVLSSATDDELHLFLLQLVQALRYEPNWYFDDDSAQDTVDGKPSGQQSNSPFMSPLAEFLFERAGASESLSLNLYWFLKVETDTQDDESRTLYTGILSAFIRSLMTSGGQDGIDAASQLQALDDYLGAISACQREARKIGSKRWMLGRSETVEATFNRLLVEQGLQKLPAGFSSLPSPLDPSIQLLSLDKMSKMFKSALYPCVIDFFATRRVLRRDSITRSSRADAEGQSFSHRVLFKCGDDLRQDQLIMYLFSLMDMQLKKVNLDLRLRTYGILATGQKDGLMEFVDSMPISGVETPRQSIFDYLQAHNPNPSDPSKIHPECLDTFIKSCAGSCVLTYILGVGDRHHDNIMLTKRGQLFHIDFGFVFGKDPKPMPPPFRLSRGMVDAMGGIESDGFIKFGKNCCQAFNWLRKSASVILNLISLMGDSGIPVIEQMGLPAVLEVVETRFRLNMTDEEAESYFLALMESTVHAVMPDLIDFFHSIAVKMK